MDAFDRSWQWATKALDDPMMIPADVHNAVMAMSEADRQDRARLNEAVRQRLMRPNV